MRHRKILSALSLLATCLFSTGLWAQESTEVSILVKKDGKVVQDTTYRFDSAEEAKQALKMMEVMSDIHVDMEDLHYNYSMAHTAGSHSSAMVFISEDGDKTKITQMQGDSLVWIHEGEGDGNHLVIVKEGNGESFDVLVDEDGDKVVKKRIKVRVSEDEKGDWTVVPAEEGHWEGDEHLKVISEDDNVKVEIRKIMEETDDGEDVQVIVIKKVKEEDMDSDADMDHDQDVDHDEDVDVKVIKKKQENTQK